MDSTHCPLCGLLSEDEREALYQSLHATTKRYSKGSLIARQGDTVEALFLLTEGRVKTEMVTESGSLLAVETLVAPHPLAPAFLFAENNRFPVNAIALEPCEVVLIPKASVMQQLGTNPHFLKSYMALSADRTQFLTERLQLLSIKTIKGKLAYYIRQRQVNGTFKMDRNQTELADYFGVARPSLARSFTEMIDEGTITRDGKVVNADRLKQYMLG